MLIYSRIQEISIRLKMSGTWISHFVILIFTIILTSTSDMSSAYKFDAARSGDAFGRQFFVVLPVEADINVRSVHNIFISSRSSQIVRAHLSRPDSKSWPGVDIKIQSDIIANATLYMTAEPLRNPFNPNGIPLQIDAEGDVSVWVVPGRGDSVQGGYRALPRKALGKNYASVLYPASKYMSEIVMFNPNAEKNGITRHIGNVSINVTVDNRTIELQEYGFSVPQMDSAKIVSVKDLSGIQLSGTDPMVVTSGRNCPSMTSPLEHCTNLMDQMSPIGSFGRSFVIVPQISAGPSELKLRIVSAFSINTTLSTFDPSGELQESWTMSGEEFYKDITASAKRSLTIRSSDPVSVAQFFTDGQQRLDFAAMINIPPVEQFTNTTVVFPALNHTIFKNNLVVVTRCEHRNDILLNSKDISKNYSYSVQFSQENSTVHGFYCIFNTTIRSGSHTLKLRKGANIGAAYSAMLYGSGNKQAYGYTVAADVQEIVCEVGGGHVELCHFYVPPDYNTPSANSTESASTNAGGPKGVQGPDHTVAIVVVLVVLSSLAIIIVGIIVLGSCGKNKGPRVAWRRLEGTGDIHYDPSFEDEGSVRMDSV